MRRFAFLASWIFEFSKHFWIFLYLSKIFIGLLLVLRYTSYWLLYVIIWTCRISICAGWKFNIFLTFDFFLKFFDPFTEGMRENAFRSFSLLLLVLWNFRQSLKRDFSNLKGFLKDCYKFYGIFGWIIGENKVLEQFFTFEEYWIFVRLVVFTRKKILILDIWIFSYYYISMENIYCCARDCFWCFIYPKLFCKFVIRRFPRLNYSSII